MRTLEEITHWGNDRINNCCAYIEGVDLSGFKPTPNYCKDANANLKARSILAEDEMIAWCVALGKLLWGKAQWDGADPSFSIRNWLAVVNAPAREQAIAYVYVKQPKEWPLKS